MSFVGENFSRNQANSFDDFYQDVKDFIKFLPSNSLFEITKVSLAGDAIIGYSCISPVASSFIFIMEQGDKAFFTLELIYIPRKMKHKKRSRIKADSSLPAMGGG